MFYIFHVKVFLVRDVCNLMLFLPRIWPLRFTMMLHAYLSYHGLWPAIRFLISHFIILRQDCLKAFNFFDIQFILIQQRKYYKCKFIAGLPYTNVYNLRVWGFLTYPYISTLIRFIQRITLVSLSISIMLHNQEKITCMREMKKLCWNLKLMRYQAASRYWTKLHRDCVHIA